MKNFDKNAAILIFLYFILISYLVINTGVISDDFDSMFRMKNISFFDALTLKGDFSFIETPVEYFTHNIWYCFLRLNNQIAPNILKILYIFLSFYLISLFFRIFLNKQSAFLASFLFVFFPSHESTVYWFMGQYLTLSFAFYLYAFYLAHKNKLTLAFLFALLASFISYGSTPIAIALFLLFTLHKAYKKGLILLIPNVLYVAYYIFLSRALSIGIDRIGMAKDASIYSIAKRFALQILTFIDSMVGPSMWLKIYYAFSQISLVSLAIGALLVIVFYKKYREKRVPYNPKRVFSFTVLAILSFAMFAVTGFYPQFAFNLGNRVTIFGSLLVVYLIVLMPASRKLRTLIFASLVFCILGISDHWKSWNLHQQEVITNIKNNPGIKNYRENRRIYVSGNQYSKYGPVSHIEFLSEAPVSVSVFRLAQERFMSVHPINKRHKYEKGYLTDMKYNRKEKVSDYIYVYDSERDVFFKLDARKINNYVESLPPQNRHWVQMINVPFIRNLITRLMPRSKYAL
jgi:hypothetical protein